MADLGSRSLAGDQRIVRGHIRQQRCLIVQDAIIHQSAGALALAIQTNDPLQGIVGTAGGGQQRVTRTQQAEQRHCQGVGAAHELTAHQRILTAHHLRKDLFQLGTARIPQAIPGSTQHICGGHLGIGKGPQHLELVIVPDLLCMAEIGLAQLHGLLVQGQHLGFKIKKLVQHSIYGSFLFQHSSGGSYRAYSPRRVKPRRV